MPVAFPIEALLMGAKSRHPAFHLLANGAPGNGDLATGDLRGVSATSAGDFEPFNFDHGG